MGPVAAAVAVAVAAVAARCQPIIYYAAASFIGGDYFRDIITYSHIIVVCELHYSIIIPLLLFRIIYYYTYRYLL